MAGVLARQLEVLEGALVVATLAQLLRVLRSVFGDAREHLDAPGELDRAVICRVGPGVIAKRMERGADQSPRAGLLIDITRFAEELTGRPWHSCRTADLWLVIDEFRSVLETIALNERRRAERAARPAPNWGWPDVSPN